MVAVGKVRGNLMDALHVAVTVIGAGADGCWLSAFVQSEQARKLDAFGGDYFVADREYGPPDATVKCACGLLFCIGHLVRRYTLRVGRGRNAYVDMRRHVCPRCGLHVPVPALPLSAD